MVEISVFVLLVKNNAMPKSAFSDRVNPLAVRFVFNASPNLSALSWSIPASEVIGINPNVFSLAKS